MMGKSAGHWARRIRWVLTGLLALLLLLALALWGFLRASLPRLDGELPAPGLTAKVSIRRDALGVPAIEGASRADVAYATGYLHAQDRYFQMDLLRRVAAGELAELFGPVALDTDRDHRLHRFRARADAILNAMPADERALLDRYVAGVNAGLHDLGARPFEYGLLRTAPAPWRATDSLLVVWAMYFDLQGHQQGRELARGWLADHSTPAQRQFLLPASSSWDAPLDAAAIVTPPVPIPATAPDWFGKGGDMKRLAALELQLQSAVGSNNWAVAGSRTVSGGATVANDMHLGLRLPHIWYRAELQFPAGNGQMRRVTGVTLPGAPLVVVGSNGEVAWGFTNSYGDYVDLIAVTADPKQPDRVQLGDRWETVITRQERIAVKGAADEVLAVRETSLGPIWQAGDQAYVVHWVAHEAGAVNLNLMGLEQAHSLADALQVGNRAGIPAQNMVAGDTAGHIGWTIAGPLPDRAYQDADSFPLRGANLALTWAARRAPADYPRVIDPPGGQLWTANARQLAGADYAKLGDGGADLGARAQQIRDDLQRLPKASERDVYSVVLDDRALFMAGWRSRALAALDASALSGHPQRAEFRRLLTQSWDGHAGVSSVGYRLARGYMHALYAQLFGGADVAIHQLSESGDVDVASPRWPVVVARLLDEQPPGWLPPGYADWQAVSLAAIDHVIADLSKDGKPLAEASWGAFNTSRIGHPFARLLPALKPWLAAPAEPLPGDNNMPRVQGPAFGPSERMTLTPGHESTGIFNMPGGQSGHPLSPYFLAGHAAWVKAEATPFLPGPAMHTLTLLPAAAQP